MIFPEDYKQVGVKDSERQGDPIYFSTKYLLSLDGPSLYSVKSRGEGFLREAEELVLLASGRQIRFYDEKTDTRNRAHLIDLAAEICGKGIDRGEGRAASGQAAALEEDSPVNTVVFQGADEHITFVKDPDPSQVLAIEVMDVSPPDPPWLLYTLSRLEDCGLLGDLMVRFVPKVLDLRAFEGEGVYFPCRAAGLGRSLDCDELVHDRPKIVGCEVSREIYLARHPGSEHDFVNICPLKSRDSAFQPERPFLTRCCRSERKGPVEKNGQPGMAVHWGDGPWEIALAVRQLASALRRGAEKR